MKHTTMTRTLLASSILLGLTNMSVYAQESETDEADVERIEIKGSLGSLPGQDVESVFGFGKSLLETPRSASTISGEQLERFSVSDIDELVAFSPGTFTQSFFGVAGSLDVRGTPGETYFRGVRRLDNQETTQHLLVLQVELILLEDQHLQYMDLLKLVVT